MSLSSIGRAQVFLCVVFAAGCGSAHKLPDHVKTVAVSGILTYQGKPLPSHQVIFTPSDGQRPARGRTDAGGKFTLGTNIPGDGAAVALCKVSIVFDPEMEVDSTQADPIDDPTKLPKAPIQLPKKFADPETSDLIVDVPAEGLSDYKLDLK